MKTRHTEHETEIMLKLPRVAAERINQMIQRTLISMGHAISHLNDEEDVRHGFGENSSEAPPGLILRGFRSRIKMTQIELAEKLRITQARVSEMESGKRSISVKMAKKLAQLFETSHKAFL
jgi:DNA-binding XRE family transcriptional regulator